MPKVHTHISAPPPTHTVLHTTTQTTRTPPHKHPAPPRLSLSLPPLCHAHISPPTYAHTYIQFLHNKTHTNNRYTLKQTHTHMRAHTHTRARTHTHTHADTHMHTFQRGVSSWCTPDQEKEPTERFPSMEGLSVGRGEPGVEEIVATIEGGGQRRQVRVRSECGVREGGW